MMQDRNFSGLSLTLLKRQEGSRLNPWTEFQVSHIDLMLLSNVNVPN